MNQSEKNGMNQRAENTETIYINLLTPLTADFYRTVYPEDYDEGYDPMQQEELDGRELKYYEEEINEMVGIYNTAGGDVSSEGRKECNLMDYFDGRASIAEKVDSAIVSVKSFAESFMDVLP